MGRVRFLTAALGTRIYCHVYANGQGDKMQSCEEALAALDLGEPIHVSGEEMRRFIAVLDARR